MSPAPGERPTPSRAPAPLPKPAPSRAGLWILLLVGVAVIAAVFYYQRSRQAERAAHIVVATRVASVTAGAVERTLRLSGTTAAESSAALISPQLRGSRGDHGRDHEGGAGAAATSPTIQSKQGGNTSPGASSGNAANMSSSLRSATTRIGNAPRTPGAAGSSASSTASGAGSTSSAMGSQGLGSTSGSLFSIGGGGGGGGDFTLVLQDVVPPGTTVRKGQTVAEFDRQYMLLRLEDYKSSVLQAEAAVARSKADMAVARKIKEQDIASAKAALDKARLDMKTAPVLSAIDTERAKLALSEAEAKYKSLLSDMKNFDISQAAQLRNTELDLRETKVEMRRAEMNVERMVLKASIDGMTVMQSIPRGGELAQVQKGDQLYPGMMFMTIVDPRSMVVNASVNQVDIERLRIGQKAYVHFDAYPDLKLPARLYSIGGVPKQGGQRASYVKEIAVRLKLDQVDPRVIPDLSVSADVVLDSEQNATVAPLASVFRDDDGKTLFAYVKEGEKWARRVIELGLSNNLMVAIRSGLKPGEVVALEVPQTGTK